ncbi:MAG: hypothetical protein ACOYLH_06415 [Flavobacteriales bacterium]|jgi:hypothetical protein
MKINLGILLIALSLLAVSFDSCYYDNEEYLYGGTTTCDSTRVATYNGDVQTIIANNCFGGCHEQASGSGGIVLEGYVNLKNETMNGDVMCSIRHEGCSPMPKSSPKMSDCDIQLLEKWIADGYPEN